MTSADLEDRFSVATPSETQLGTLEEHVNSALRLSAQIEDVGELLSKLNNELQSLVVVAIPNAMAAANVSEFKTKAGVKITIRDVLNGSLPKDEKLREKALRWLEKNDGEDLIKVALSASFARGEGGLADKVRMALSKMKIAYNDKEDVHPQTLQAFARELIREGKKVPLETLGLSSIRIAKIALPVPEARRPE